MEQAKWEATVLLLGCLESDGYGVECGASCLIKASEGEVNHTMSSFDTLLADR